MPSLEELAKHGEVVALESGMAVRAEMVSVLSRGFRSISSHLRACSEMR